MGCLPSWQTARYAPLRASEGDEKEEVMENKPAAQTLNSWPIAHTALMLLSIALSIVFGFSLGYLVRLQKHSGLLVPAGNVHYPMVYNQTFTKAPSIESNAAWDSMFPEIVGFVKHPSISPRLSGLAVFHELHCVNMLRIGYYAALDGTIEELQNVHDHNKRPDPHHLRHCFDYLRQSLLCVADTNLEPVDAELGGVTGWSFQRTCRDFDAVKEWAEEWGSWDESLSAIDEH